MNDLEALVKTILLLVFEHKHGGITSIELADLVRKHIEENKTKYYNGEGEIINKLHMVLTTIIENGIDDVNSISQSLATALTDRPVLNNLVLEDLTTTPDDKIISSRRREILNFINMLKVKSIIEKAAKRLNRKNANVSKLVNEITDELSTIVDLSDIKDDAILSEVDFDNDDELSSAVKESANLAKTTSVLKTGWKCINEMLQGGFRRGEFCMISALPHNYKSGFVKSIFLQLGRLNEPVLDDTSKKPMMLFFSFEEELKVVLLFFYAYLKFLKEGKAVNVNKEMIDEEEMKEYLKKYLYEESKYRMKIIRMDPTKTTYSKIVKIVDLYTKQGYEIHAVVCDYLSQISTEGCVKNGPAGTEYKDLFKRMRNEMSSRNILFITPHQLSTEAKRLIRNGLPLSEFVKALPGKGYYAHSSQLDQEVDLEIFLGKASINRKPHLTVQRGKHRIPTIVDEEKLYAVLEFPRGAPIPEDTEEKSFCKGNGIVEEDFGF